jgi:hypothetical protein
MLQIEPRIGIWLYVQLHPHAGKENTNNFLPESEVTTNRNVD